MAFILGIYEELLDTIKSFNLEFIRKVLTLKWVDAYQHVNGNFLVSLVLGLAVSILSLARVVTWLYEEHPEFLFAFFFGLVLGSIVVIGRHISWGAKTGVAVVLGTLIAYLIVTLVPVDMPSDPFTLLWCGAIAITAMILPGISGSFILLILGQYHTVMQAVKGLDIITLIPFAVGAAGGLMIFSRILSFLLKRFHQVIISFLVGFMIGSLWKIWPFRRVVLEDPETGKLIQDTVTFPGWGATELWLCAGLAVAGFLLVASLERLQQKLSGGAIRTLGG